MDGEIDPETLRERLSGDDGATAGDESDEGNEGGEGGEGGHAGDGESGPLIVDIRSPEGFAEGHLPGSHNVPLADLPGEIDRIAEAEEVVTVCPHGKASVKAARIVGAYRDFDGQVVSLEGGLDAWDGPLEATAEDGGEGAEDRESAEDVEGRADDQPDAPF